MSSNPEQTTPTVRKKPANFIPPNLKKKQETQKILAKRVLARRRLLQFTQLTHPRYHAGWVHDDICRRLEQFSQQVTERKSPRLMLLMPPRHGKLLADDTLVYTPDGWKTHGSLKVGDKVMGLTGWTSVIGISPPGIADMEIVTNAGTRIQCHHQHEWAVDVYRTTSDNKSRKQYVYGVHETQYFAEYKAKHGSLRIPYQKTMRKFYLPVPDFEYIANTPHRSVVALRRFPMNGGRLAIEDVNYLAEPKPGRCIQVSAPDGVYLVTRDFVPTHNSELASIRFPAWHLGHHPEHEIINVGYNLELPMRFSRKVREVARDSHYQAIFPSMKLDPESQSAEAWNTTQGGGFTAAGVGGGITGKGAHILIIDDPIKNQEEADSVGVRDKLWDWYQSTAYTRLAPGGGVLLIECMTGDTPVLMADGMERRLDAVTAGDVVATYRNGALSSARVVAQKSSGRDSLLKITTKSGKVVRANGRHPFLTVVGGEQIWTRARFLTTDHTIVAAKASAVSGLASRVQQTGAPSPLSAEACATSTTTERSGPMGTVRPGTQIRSACGTPLGSTGMGSLEPSTTGCSASSMGCAQSVGALPPRSLSPKAGGTSCASTTTTPPDGFVASSATNATSESATLPLSLWHVPPQITYDFTLDPVVSIEPDGEAEVFDLQVEGTENFIANGLVSHNTWWNDDDLAGRLQNAMGKDPQADQFVIVKYPALSEAWEYRDEATGEILRFDEEQPPVEGRTFLRPKDYCLHEDRYSTPMLKRIKSNMQPRIWSALFQQNPVPDEGMYFRREFFRYQDGAPPVAGRRVLTAWDFAIGEKQQNDWTVGATVMLDEQDNIHVLDIMRFKGDSFQIVEAMLDTALRWGSQPESGYVIGAEDGQIWRAIEPLLSKRMLERGLYPPYEVLRPMTDKMARARPLQGRMQQGRVIFPRGASWLEAAEQELLRFPAGTHDDIVDGLAWAAQMCLGRSPNRVPDPKPLPSWRDKLIRYGVGNGSHMAA